MPTNPSFLVDEARRRIGLHRQDPYITTEKTLRRIGEIALSAFLFSIVFSIGFLFAAFATWQIFGPTEPVTEISEEA